MLQSWSNTLRDVDSAMLTPPVREAGKQGGGEEEEEVEESEEGEGEVEDKE